MARELMRPANRSYIKWPGTEAVVIRRRRLSWLCETFFAALCRRARLDEDAVAVKLVNLDALIRREDFDIEVGPTKAQSVEGADKLKILSLKKNS